MGLIPRALPVEEEEKLKKLIFLRLILSTLIIGAAITVLQLHAVVPSIVVFYTLLGMVYITTGSVYFAYRYGVSLGLLIRLLIGVDLAVLTLIAHYSGGSASYFTILFVLPVLIGGSFFHVAGGLTTAVLATSVYFTYGFLEYSGVISSPSGEVVTSEPGSVMSSHMLRGYLHMVIFVLAGLLSGYVSRHIQSKGEELADKEKEIRRMQLDTDSIIRNMSSGLVVTDMKGEILTINPAAMSILGIDDENDYKGHSIESVTPHMPVLARELESVLESGIPRRRHEIEARKKDGAVLPLGISISILRDEAGETRGLIAIFQDLTEVKQMRERVRQADRMAAVGELSAAIAHEVRAPLASICGSIEMLKGEFELSGDNEELMNLILKESDRLDNIISDFLEYARLRKPAFAFMDIDKCIGEIALLLKHSPNLSHKATIDVKSEISGCCRIEADDEQIKQVFLNLGLNACEEIRKNGNLTINLKKVMEPVSDAGYEEECVRIDFRNDGPPIPREVIPHVFEPFFTTKEGGTGLGLSIAARIVESHSGMISVSSSKEEGTVFTVILPVNRPAMDESDLIDLEEDFESYLNV